MKQSKALVVMPKQRNLQNGKWKENFGICPSKTTLHSGRKFWEGVHYLTCGISAKFGGTRNGYYCLHCRSKEKLLSCPSGWKSVANYLTKREQRGHEILYPASKNGRGGKSTHDDLDKFHAKENANGIPFEGAASSYFARLSDENGSNGHPSIQHLSWI